MISKIEFRHGSRTCELENKPCVWQGTGGFGAWLVCTFFFKQRLYSTGHGLARCPQCIERFGGEQ